MVKIMFYLSILIPTIVSFLFTFFVSPYVIRFMQNIGVVGIDQQKKGKPKVATSGGVAVAFGFFAGIMCFIAINTFITKSSIDLLVVLAATLTIFLTAIIGFFDDIYMEKRKTKNEYGELEYRKGLRQWIKPVLTLPAAIPLMAVFAGTTSMALPLIGTVEFGAIYPLLLIPVAVVCVSNATNMLAGVNGLEAGLMLIASFFLGIYCLIYGSFEGGIIALSSAAALSAILFFNWTPAKLLPGDSLTYFTGGAFVSAAIIGNVEKFALIIFTPWIIEAFLKLRGRFKVRSYGDLQKDGTIKEPYKEIYSLTHFAMKFPKYFGRKGFTEEQVALFLMGIELIICILAFVLVKAPI